MLSGVKQARRLILLIVALGAPLAVRPALAQFNVEQSAMLCAQLRTAPGYLGLGVDDVTPDVAGELKLPEEGGVLVRSIEPGSPAQAAGIRAGDVVLNYNGENVLGVGQFARMVQETPPQRKIKLQLWRDGKMHTVTAMTAARPSDASPSSGLDGFNPLYLPDIPMPLVAWKSLLLGIVYEPLTPELAQFFDVKSGVLVRSVERSSPADRAGLKAGDILIAIGAQPLLDSRDLNSYFRIQHRRSGSLPLSVKRDRKPLTLTVTLVGDR
jgi:serine protease Do